MPTLLEQITHDIAEAMKQSRVYIVADDVPVELRANLEDLDVGGNVFATPPKETE